MKNTQRREKGALLLKFLEGSKRYFALSIIASALASLIDMITPQIIRASPGNTLPLSKGSYRASAGFLLLQKTFTFRRSGFLSSHYFRS